MTIRRVALVVALVVGAAACSSDDSSSDGVDEVDVTVPGSPTTVAATLSTGFFGNAQSAACDTDLTVLSTAVELYLAARGTVAITEEALIEAGMLREASTLHDIGVDNTVVPSPGGGCVS